MVTTIKITGDGVFIQSVNGAGPGGGGPAGGGGGRGRRLAGGGNGVVGSAAIGEAALPVPDSDRNGHQRNGHNGGSLDVVDGTTTVGPPQSPSPSPLLPLNDTNNNQKGYRNFNHRRYQSDEGPGFIKPDQAVLKNGGDRGSPAATGSSASDVGGESDGAIIGPADPGRKRDKFTISFLNTHRSGQTTAGGGGKGMLNHKFIVYNSKKPKTSSVLHQQYYQQQQHQQTAGGSVSHYQQYLYNRLRPSLSTSVLTSPSLLTGTGPIQTNGRTDQHPQPPPYQLIPQRDPQQLYQNGLFHQQHRALLGTAPPAAIPGWTKSTSCLVTSSTSNSSYRASPLLLLSPSDSSPPSGLGPASSSISSPISSPFSSSSSSSASPPVSSGPSSSSNSPPPTVTPPPPATTTCAPTTPTTTTSSGAPPSSSTANLGQ
ncbi:putative uncharacterized protein DDB_G0277255 [Anopheles cruzii]|uniref:putative uncharacterized protein DDB_G0277255 n=1 Tax=Anopheles cruzii TaxID=68878 RepID=UPI0022EC216B|nr:putative uncharacterized protein DDB_G0277255 [Anopheles cruzii]